MEKNCLSCKHIAVGVLLEPCISCIEIKVSENACGPVFNHWESDTPDAVSDKEV